LPAGSAGSHCRPRETSSRRRPSPRSQAQRAASHVYDLADAFRRRGRLVVTSKDYLRD
jgi:hypothetical protein